MENKSYDRLLGVDLYEPKKIKRLTDKIIEIVLNENLNVGELISLMESVRHHIGPYIANAEIKRDINQRTEEDRYSVLAENALQKETEDGEHISKMAYAKKKIRLNRKTTDY